MIESIRAAFDDPREKQELIRNVAAGIIVGVVAFVVLRKVLPKVT